MPRIIKLISLKDSQGGDGVSSLVPIAYAIYPNKTWGSVDDLILSVIQSSIL